MLLPMRNARAVSGVGKEMQVLLRASPLNHAIVIPNLFRDNEPNAPVVLKQVQHDEILWSGRISLDRTLQLWNKS